MDLQRLTSRLRQCIQQYDMIKEGDHLAVGVSGGKDSLTLLWGLKKLQSFYPVPFHLSAIYVDLGIADTSLAVERLSQWCDSLDVPFYPVSTRIYDIVFQEKKEENPCSLCAKLRKGALNRQALDLGCNKVAYAHHKDDFIETSLMSLLLEGRYYCFPPVTHLDRTGLTVIRPMLYVDEEDIKGFARRNRLPVFQNPCPADGNTSRQKVKEWITDSAAIFPDIRKNLNAAVLNYFEDILSRASDSTL